MALSGYERIKRHRAKKKAELDQLRAEVAELRARPFPTKELLDGLRLKTENRKLHERIRRLLVANLRLKQKLIERDEEVDYLMDEVNRLNELFMNEADGLSRALSAIRRRNSGGLLT